MASWLEGHLSALPNMCVPVIGMDLNDELGARTARVADVDADEMVGVPSHKPEGYASRALRDVMEAQNMAAASTFSERYEPTYFPAAGMAPTRVDYMFMPISYLSRVEGTGVLRRAAKGLQLFPRLVPPRPRPGSGRRELGLDLRHGPGPPPLGPGAYDAGLARSGGARPLPRGHRHEVLRGCAVVGQARE